MPTHNIVGKRNKVNVKQQPIIYTVSDAIFKAPKSVSLYVSSFYENIKDQEEFDVKAELDLEKIKEIIDTKSIYQEAEYKKIGGFDLDDVVANYFAEAKPDRLLSFKSSSRPQELISIYPDGEVNRTNFKYEDLIVNIPSKYGLVLKD